MLLHNEERVNQIRENIKKFGDDIVKAGQDIFIGLEKGDAKKFEDVKIVLKNVQSSANDIDNDIIASLALFGVEAADLRELVSYLKITNELIRIADNIKGFAKNINSLDEEHFTMFKECVIQLYKSSMSAVKIAINSIGGKGGDSEDAYMRVKVEESKSDDLYAILEKNILSEIGKNFDLNNNYIQILRTMRKLEKMADRSVAIAKLVLFAKDGGELRLY